MEYEFVRLVLYMTRSRVLPAIWVGEWICWVRLFNESIIFRRLELFDSMFMSILRSPSMMVVCFPLAIVLVNSVRNLGIELWGGRLCDDDGERA